MSILLCPTCEEPYDTDTDVDHEMGCLDSISAIPTGIQRRDRRIAEMKVVADEYIRSIFRQNMKIGKLIDQARTMKDLLSDCQDRLCSGDGVDEKQHAERMLRINEAIGHSIVGLQQPRPRLVTNRDS